MGRMRLSTSKSRELWRSGPMHASLRRTVQVLILAFVTLSFLLAYVRNGTIPAPSELATFRSYPPGQPHQQQFKQRTCAPDLESLRRNKVSSHIEYTRVEIDTEWVEDIPEPVSTRIEDLGQPLPGNITISTERRTFKPKLVAPCEPPIHVRVPKPPPRANAPHLVIGAATTVPRLEESLEAWAHWGANTRVRIFVLVEPHDNVSKVERKARKMGFDITITESSEKYDDRYFSLIRHLYAQRDERTQWAVVIDDDTFFPSMNRLLSRLSRPLSVLT